MDLVSSSTRISYSPHSLKPLIFQPPSAIPTPLWDPSPLDSDPFLPSLPSSSVCHSLSHVWVLFWLILRFAWGTGGYGRLFWVQVVKFRDRSGFAWTTVSQSLASWRRRVFSQSLFLFLSGHNEYKNFRDRENYPIRERMRRYYSLENGRTHHRLK